MGFLHSFVCLVFLFVFDFFFFPFTTNPPNQKDYVPPFSLPSQEPETRIRGDDDDRFEDKKNEGVGEGGGRKIGRGGGKTRLFFYNCFFFIYHIIYSLFRGGFFPRFEI